MIRKGRAAKAFFFLKSALRRWTRGREGIDLRCEDFSAVSSSTRTGFRFVFQSSGTASFDSFRLSSLGKFSRSVAVFCSRAAAALSSKDAWRAVSPPSDPGREWVHLRMSRSSWCRSRASFAGSQGCVRLRIELTSYCSKFCGSVFVCSFVLHQLWMRK
jgi:hypothetical protein